MEPISEASSSLFYTSLKTDAGREEGRGKSSAVEKEESGGGQAQFVERGWKRATKPSHEQTLQKIEIKQQSIVVIWQTSQIFDCLIVFKRQVCVVCAEHCT